MYKTRKNIEKLFIQSKKSDQIGSHIIGFDVLLKGGIDFHKIKSVFYQTINEYSVFKSLFRLSNKGLLRKYSNRLTSTFRIINCKKNRNNLQQIILSNSAKDIDPEKGRSISSSLYILNDNESVLSISASHLVVDAMSLEIVLKKILKNLELVSLKNNLDIISVSRNLESPSNFKLVPVLEVSSILNNSDKEKLESIGRNNNLSLFSLLLSTFGEFQSKYNYVGCLFSNRRKSQINEVDCFVQALPLYLPHNRNIILCAKEITSQIFSINKYIRSNDSIPEYEGFKAMFSMVVNPVIDLSSNSGLVMEYIRRLHTKPECDFHVYFYQFKDRIEVVFNYDPEKINREGTEDLLKRYIHYLKCFLSSKPKSEFHKNNDSQVIAAFHHIGVASWEFDIGKRRIEKRYSEMLQSNKVVDNQLNIEMAYYEKIGLELIAPINEKAPCNAFLKRDGEGPYHICWKVSDIDKTLSILDRGSIEYILIQKDGKSELFEESFICFVNITGFGLVEFLQDSLVVDSVTDQQNILERVNLNIEIETNNYQNAFKFLHIIGYKAKNPLLRIWKNSDTGILFSFQPVRKKEPVIKKVILGNCLKNNDTLEKKEEEQKLSEKWNRRLEINFEDIK